MAVHAACGALQPLSIGHDAIQEFRDPEICEDNHKLCPNWAKNGECDKNPKYMVGDDSRLGACRLSCGACESCAAHDNTCKSQNRMRAGYLPILDL